MRPLVLTLFVCLFAGCPPEKPPCNASTCAGCCTQAGECLPGNEKAACGREGLFCRACEAADTCSNGRCDLVLPDAGVCPGGFHRCGATCASNTDVATCGARCTPCPGSTNGRATCTNETCGLACNVGFHACGSICADDTATESCGDRCGPCSAPANSKPACTNRQCDFACDNGFHRCGDACADSTAPATCGSRCTPCPAPANATPSCLSSMTDAGVPLQTCDFVCNAGFHRCGSVCVADNDPSTCGTRCAPCPSEANGAPACVNGQCAITCATGFNRCNGACVPATSPAACGAACAVCTAPDGGAAVCANNSCSYTCASGFNPCNGACTSATDVTSCGSSCTRCPLGVPGSQPTCDGTTCATVCEGSNTRCGSSCVGANVAAACGASCTACPGGSGRDRPTCSGTTCGLACIDTTCSGACADRQRDATNCGTCGTTCPGGGCVEGQCRQTCANGVVFSGIAETLPHAFTIGVDPRFWLVDVTGDARLDLLAAGGNARVSFVNTGNAHFLAPTIADAGATLLPLGAADFTLDGRADLLAGDPRSLWVIQQGAGGFVAPLVLFTNGQNAVTLVADFTGDGRADLVRVPQIANLNADFWINQSADGGAPFSQTRNQAPNLLQAEFARAADLNNDGRADIITAQAGTVRTFVASGASSFMSAASAGPQSGLIGLAAGDVTRDLNRDVVTITASAIFQWSGDGAGALAAPVLVANAGGTLGAVEIEDLDRDGFADIALATSRGFEVLWNSSSGAFSPADVYEIDGFTSAAPATGLHLADVTGDGRLDAVLWSSQTRPVFVRNTTGRGFDRTVKTPTPSPEFLLAGRIDGDSREDLLVSRRATVTSMSPIATQTRVLRASGAGGFTGGAEDLLTRPEAMADFDQDGAMDVLRLDCSAGPLPDGGVPPQTATCAARVEYGAMLRFGSASQALALNEQASEVWLRAADVDGDERVDVIGRTRAGLWFFRNSGPRQFAAPIVTGFPLAVTDLAIADFDRDGRRDVVVLAGSSAPRSVFVLLGRASGFVLAPRVGNFDFDSSIAAGFITGDGFPDLAGSTGILLQGDGTAGFSRGPDWKPAPTTAGVSFVVDVDADGRGELVNRQFNATVLANPDAPPRGFAGRVERFADVTGDGIVDWVQLTPTDVVVGVGRCR